MKAKQILLWLAAALLLTPFLTASVSDASLSVTCSPTSSGNWSTIGWSCGHTPGIGIGVGDNVVLGSIFVTQDIDVSIGSLTLGGGFSNAPGKTMTLSGNWTKTTNDSYTTGTGTVVFAGPGPQTITGTVGGACGDVACPTEFYNLTIGSQGTVSVGARIATKGLLTIDGGTLATGSQYPLQVKGSIVNNGTLRSTGETRFANAAATLSGSGTYAFHTVIIEYGATLTSIPGTITVAGDWQDWPAGFRHNNGTVEFTNTAARTLNGNSMFYNLRVTAGSTVNVLAIVTLTIADGGTVSVEGTLAFPSAMWDSGSSRWLYGYMRSATTGVSTLAMGPEGVLLTVNRYGLGPAASNTTLLIQTGGSWNTDSVATAGTIEYRRGEGPGAVTDRDYFNLRISGSGKTWTLAAPRRINGTLAIVDDGSLTLAGGSSLILGGDLVITSSSGTPLSTGTTVVVLGGTGRQVIGGNVAFAELRVDNPAGVALSSNITVNDALYLLAGPLDLSGNTLTLKKNLFNNGGWLADGGALALAGTDAPAAVGTLALAGTSSQAITGTNPTAFPSLTLNNSAGAVLYRPATVSDTLTLQSGVLNNSGQTLTVADGGRIRRSAGSLSAAPIFAGVADVAYANSSALTTGYELPAVASALRNLSVGGAGTVTLAAGSNPTVNGSLLISAGQLAAGANTLILRGDWTRAGGAFNPGTGIVVFGGAGTAAALAPSGLDPFVIQTLTGDTTFNNLVVGSGVTLTTSSVVTVTGALVNDGWTAETRAVAATPPFSLTFPLANVVVGVQEAGSLVDLRVARRNEDHPNATGAQLTGVYWNLMPDGADYVLRVSLPHDGLADPAACRWTGATWDCGREGFTINRVTRGWVTGLSDWAVGDAVCPGPPAAPALSASISGPDVRVSWSDALNTWYRIWSSTDPYLTPDDPGGSEPTIQARSPYIDGGAAASEENHFYIGRAIAGCSAASGDSNRTGEFTFVLVPGTP